MSLTIYFGGEEVLKFAKVADFVLHNKWRRFCHFQLCVLRKRCRFGELGQISQRKFLHRGPFKLYAIVSFLVRAIRVGNSDGSSPNLIALNMEESLVWLCLDRHRLRNAIEVSANARKLLGVYYNERLERDLRYVELSLWQVQ